MRKAVLRKFKTHKDICEVLLSTGDELIVENSLLITTGDVVKMAVEKIG
jgi:predicted NAD-dependent protein-ADP-ribosyltransferase YbiA (DUF1768 family)